MKIKLRFLITAVIVLAIYIPAVQAQANLRFTGGNNSPLTITRATKTSSLSYYRFNDIAAGQSVTITVVSKRYQFAPQVVNVNEEMSGLNFLAQP
jgi:hypothetical protein